MSRKPKKRNKPYRGEDAATPPTVQHYHAVVRSPLGNWWYEHKRQVKLLSAVGAVILIVVYAVYELIHLVF